MFSDLNNLIDLSMDRQFQTLCGMTDKEMHTYFEESLHQIAENYGITYDEVCLRLKERYDGYRFRQNGTNLYNPFSLLNTFRSLEFGSYWFETGTPTYLVKLLKDNNFCLPDLTSEGVTAEALTDVESFKNNPIAVIYQSGYLTIKDYDREFQLYKLEFPNEEVRYGFLSFIAPFYTSITDDDKGFYIGKFIQELRAGKVDAFLTRLRAFFADFPYELNARTERHYQVVFYLVFKLMGQFCEAEVRSARGRADAVVKTKDYIYVFEFKLDGSAFDALEQIEHTGYLIPYTAEGRQLVKVGVSFDAGERNIGEWEIENGK